MKLIGENRSAWGKTCSSATFYTTNPTRTDPGWNPGLRQVNSYYTKSTPKKLRESYIYITLLSSVI
jgi:hypothetical protein